MEKESKKRTLAFLSLLTVSIGMGLLSSCGNSNSADKGSDGVSYVTLDENGIAKLGSYPQDISTEPNYDEIRSNGSKKTTSGGAEYYLYKDNAYAMIDNVLIDEEGSSNRYLSNGEAVNDYKERVDVAIAFKGIEWQMLKENDDNTAYLISTRVLDREIYSNAEFSAIPYESATLYNYLNKNFKEMAFSDDDYKYLAYGNEGKDKVVITLPEKADVDLDNYDDKNLVQASDFAIMKNLTSHSAWNHGTGVPYTNAGYWTKTISENETDRVTVCWAKVAYSYCLMDDPKIGVRPVILVNYKTAKQGGSSSESSSKAKSSSSVNPALIVGIVLSTIGVGGLVAFFVLWGKKFPTGKPPIWMIIAVAAFAVISVSGLGCLGGGLNGGGASCFKYGYYVETELKSGNGITQVAYTSWLIKSDGTVSYSSRVKDNVSASDFAPDNYMTGTYKISGSKLVITIPKKEINNFGTIGGTYTYTIKNCGKFQNYEGAYQWVRGEE